MKTALLKIAMILVSLYRRIRAMISTAYLKWRTNKCGQHPGAARFPHIGGNVQIEIGDWCSFNGITFTGWGGGKNWQLLSFWNRCENYVRQP